MAGRGPTARRGLQFGATPHPDLIRRQEEAQATLRRLDWLARNPDVARSEFDDLRRRPASELAQLRAQTLALLTDLRAELRRRAGR